MNDGQKETFDRLYDFIDGHQEIIEESIQNYAKEHNFSRAEGVGEPAHFTINIEINSSTNNISITPKFGGKYNGNDSKRII